MGTVGYGYRRVWVPQGMGTVGYRYRRVWVPYGMGTVGYGFCTPVLNQICFTDEAILPDKSILF